MTPREIKDLRESLKMTQEEFARKLGLKTRGAISHWEAGRKVPTGPALLAMELLAENFQKKSRKKPKSC